MLAVEDWAYRRHFLSNLKPALSNVKEQRVSILEDYI